MPIETPGDELVRRSGVPGTVPGLSKVPVAILVAQPTAAKTSSIAARRHRRIRSATSDLRIIARTPPQPIEQVSILRWNLRIFVFRNLNRLLLRVEFTLSLNHGR